MNFIAHRVNTLEELNKLPCKYGVELDVRDSGNNLIIAHNPFEAGENFETYLKHYHHGTIIVNVKSERIELRILTLLEKYHINDYFFLDSSVPMINLLSNLGNTNLAVRFSEIEPVELALAMKGRAKWVWVDCFSQLPINSHNYKMLKDAGYKLCLVSPELQGQQEKIDEYKKYLQENHIIFDAICTKSANIKLWEN